MNNLKENFSDFKNSKNIDNSTSSYVVESTFRTLIKNKYGDDSNFTIIVSAANGEVEIYQNKTIVENIVDVNKEILLKDALEISSDFEIGEEVGVLLPLSTFDRRSILSAKQMILSKVSDLQNSDLVEKYKKNIGYIIFGEVYLIRKDEIILLDEDSNEISLPKSNTIPGEFFRKGESISAVVESASIHNGKSLIILSRTSSTYLQRLLEEEISQISDGSIDIVKISRCAGVKSKVVVESIDGTDPVGSIVGSRGSRIKDITYQLKGESIDVIVWTDNENLLIQRSLKPAVIEDIEIEDDCISVYVKQDQIGYTMGRDGINVYLASEILGKKIEIYSVDQLVKN